MADKNRNYELVVILNSEAEGVATEASNIATNLEKRRATVTHSEEWGKRKLFHPPKMTEDGIYHYFKFSAASDAITQITMDLNVNQKVLKSMVTVLG